MRFPVSLELIWLAAAAEELGTLRAASLLLELLRLDSFDPDDLDSDLRMFLNTDGMPGKRYRVAIYNGWLLCLWW